MGHEHVRESLEAFREEREWKQFHTPENLAKSISIESAELLECFQWNADFERAAVEEELADILTYAYFLAIELELSPEDLILKKLEVTKQKYPVEKAKGRSEKYTEF